MSGIKDRIKEFRRIKASELVPHDKNWRTHDDEQKSVMTGILNEIGYADALIVRKKGDKYQILDGHLRADTTPDMEVPVLVVDLNDSEAEKFLLTHDPIAAMASANDGLLSQLVADVDFDDASLRLFADQIGDSLDDYDVADEPDGSNGATGPTEMHLRPHEHYDYVIVLARNAQDWNVLCDLLGIELIKIQKKKRLGIGRAIEASKVITMLKG